MAKVKDRPQKQSQEKIFLASGAELTPQLEKELAAEAERGYDLSKARRRSLRRPVLADDSGLAAATFALSQREVDEVRERAEAEGRSAREVAKELFGDQADS